jgi:hypothetical protein
VARLWCRPSACRPFHLGHCELRPGGLQRARRCCTLRSVEICVDFAEERMGLGAPGDGSTVATVCPVTPHDGERRRLPWSGGKLQRMRSTTAVTEGGSAASGAEGMGWDGTEEARLGEGRRGGGGAEDGWNPSLPAPGCLACGAGQRGWGKAQRKAAAVSSGDEKNERCTDAGRACERTIVGRWGQAGVEAAVAKIGGRCGASGRRRRGGAAREPTVA